MNFDNLIDNENNLKPNVLNILLNRIEKFDPNFQFYSETDMGHPFVAADWKNPKLDKIERLLSELEIDGHANFSAEWSDNILQCKCGKGMHCDNHYTGGNIKGIITRDGVLCKECMMQDIDATISHYVSYGARYHADFVGDYDVKTAIIKEESFVGLNSVQFLQVVAIIAEDSKLQLEFTELYPNINIELIDFTNMNTPVILEKICTFLDLELLIYTGPGRGELFTIMVKY